jgi:hypothetical protein
MTARTWMFVREQLRAPLTLALLILVPVGFVMASAGVLSDFATALGGALAGDAAAALGAGWAAAFVSGIAGFFAASSATQADRRLASSGAGAGGVAVARLLAVLTLAGIASAGAFAALMFQAAPTHPWHALVAIVGFATLYAGIGVVVGSLIPRPLEGSLVVVFVFLLDAFSGPGMTDDVPLWAVSRGAGQVLVDAGLGRSSGAIEWATIGLSSVLALALGLAAFTWSARRRS